MEMERSEDDVKKSPGNDSICCQAMSNDVSIGMQSILQGEAISYTEVDEHKKFTCIKVSYVVKDKLKRSMPHTCQDQASTPCVIQPQCSNDVEEHQISEDQGEQITEKQSWWSCPWCNFKIDSGPRSRSDGIPTRCRQKHLVYEHPQKNHEAPEAKVTGVRGRSMDIQKAIDLYNGPHEFTANPKTMTCIWCDWTGKPRDIPKMCNPLKRGGLRINVQAMETVKIEGDGLCLWASLAHFSELNKYEIRQQVCEQYVVHNGSERWNGKFYESWIKAETGLSWEAYVQQLLNGQIWAGVIELHQWSKLANINIEIYVREQQEYKIILSLGRQGTTKIKLDYQNGCHYELLVKVKNKSGDISEDIKP